LLVRELRQAVGAADPTPTANVSEAFNKALSYAPAHSGYLVQVSTQTNEADAQASYRALQSKFPTVLGSRPPVIKRADLGDKAAFYQVFAGPFSSGDQATQVCSSLKAAGGPECLIRRN
jgi:hypothetical protein